MDNAQRLEAILAHVETLLEGAADREGSVAALTLETLAARSHLSPYYFSRWFRSQTGLAPMSYVRGRRLAHAVRRLRADPQADLLHLALAVGFESQQGFTRTFKQAFGLTPGRYRGYRFPLPLQERITMSTETGSVTPQPPRFERRSGFLVAGLQIVMSEATRPEIPMLWERFSPMIASVPGLVGDATYGVCVPADEAGHEHYLAGVAVREPVRTDDLVTVSLPDAEYAVFTHKGPIPRIHETFGYIFGTWLPSSAYTVTGTPDFELYSAEFNPLDVAPTMEIWIPVRTKG